MTEKPSYTRIGMFFKELKQMEIKAQNFEKEHNSFIITNNKKSDLIEELNEVANFEKELFDKRRTELSTMKHQLHKIRHAAKTFSREVSDVKNPDQHFINRVKVLMEDVEKSIRAFKENEQEKYEVLIVDERALQIDVTAMEKKTEAWSRGQLAEGEVAGAAGEQATRAAATSRDVTRDLPPEVAAFERFLTQSGGHNGGWDDCDQRAFLRVRGKHKGRPSFLDELMASLPTRTPEQCRQHEDWYREYCLLKERKKDAIEKWRAQKAESERVDLDAENEDREEGKSARKTGENSDMADRERAVKRLQVDAWKVKKEVERRRQEAEEEEAAQRQRQVEEAKKHKQREAQRARVEAYKVQKQAEHEEQLLLAAFRDAERRAQHRPTELEQRRIAARNAKMLQEKLGRKEQEKEEEIAREERLERMKMPVSVRSARDPNRLLQPTAGWSERLRANAEEVSGGGVVVGARNMPQRAVPTWRQGVN